MDRQVVLTQVIEKIKSITPRGFEFPKTTSWHNTRKTLQAAYLSGSDCEFEFARKEYFRAAEAIIGSVGHSAATSAPGLHAASCLFDFPIKTKSSEEKKSSSKQVAPCSKCGSPMFWESVYRDGVMRCSNCEPAPSKKLIGCRFAITVNDDGMPQLVDLASLLSTTGSNPRPTQAQAVTQTPRDDSRANQDAWRYFWASGRWDRVTAPTPSPGQCPRCRNSEFTDTQVRENWVRRDCAKCGCTIEHVTEVSPRSVKSHHEPQPFTGGSAKAYQAASDPNPGCDRDYRGKGGECIHAGEILETQTKIGVKVVCDTCKKFVGYRRSKSE